jgi:glucose-1-phosphate thymidylyltransferase
MISMKALVLAGGAGTRLRPLTYSMPKQLVPIANKPVIIYGLECIREAGVTDVGIIVGGWSSMIESELGDGSQLGIKITYIHQDAPRGLAHCVMIARDFLGDDDFIMYLGDNVLLGSLSPIVDDFIAHRPEAQVVVIKVPDPSEFGVAEVDDDGTVISLEEKPEKPRSDLGLMGIYLFTKVIHDAVQKIRPSRRSEWEITDALQWLVSNGNVIRAHIYSGYWRDTGRVQDLLECNRAALSLRPPEVNGSVDADTAIQGPVEVDARATVSRSRLIGPCSIGPDCVVTGSVIGPFTALGAGCEVRDSEVEDSIVLPGARIRGVRGLRGSLIGRSARVDRAGADSGRRLMIGDDTTVEIGS